MQSLVKRFYWRRALTQRNLLFYWWHYISNSRRSRRERLAAGSFSDTKQVARVMVQEGIIVGPSERFLSEEGQRALADAAKMVLNLSKQADVQDMVAGEGSSKKKSYLVELVSWAQEHSPDSPLVKLALDKKLLEIVSEYLGLWPRLHAIAAWLNLPTKDGPREAQLWHRDPEDLRLVKVFIYLGDVGANSGPFSYIPRTHPFGDKASKIPQYKNSKRITDEEMQRTFPSDSWLACTGPAKTMILADTVGYHRGGKPLEGERILITFTYTSGVPFEERKLHIAGDPAWIDADIQTAALN